MTQPAILLLGGGTDQRFIIQTAKAMGLKTVVVDMNPDSPGFADADISAVVSTRDVPALIQFAETQIKSGVNLQGVSVMGSDIPHIVSAVAAHFGWVGPSEETAHLATDKFAMKQRFAEAGVSVPRFTDVLDGNEALYYWKEWDCASVIIKPVDQAGSRGVLKLDERNRRQVKDAFYVAQDNGRSGQVILEEYVPGLQISTETIVTPDRVETPGFVDRDYEDTPTFWPQIMENGGWAPSRVDAQTRQQVMTLVESAARALGIERGVAKGDVVICPERGPMMIEMAARLSGGDFSESLVPLSTGVNYVEVALQIAMGMSPDWEKLSATKDQVVVNRYLFVPPGNLDAIEGLEKVSAVEGLQKFEIWVKPDDEVKPILHHGMRSGVFLLTADSRIAVQEKIEFIYETLRFKIDGIWHTANPQGYVATLKDTPQDTSHAHAGHGFD